MADISSPTNGRIKLIKRLLNDRRFRYREQKFVVEGSRWLNEVNGSNIQIEFWLATESWLKQNQPLAKNLTDRLPPLTIEPSILKTLANTDSPSGVLAVLPMPTLNWPNNPSFLLLLDQIRDPGNLGTLIRSALAAGAEGLLLSQGSVDPYNPKVVRSTMGALLHLPIQQVSWGDDENRWAPCSVYLADMHGDKEYTAIDWTEPSAIMIGGEANGASPEAKAIVQNTISIPMAHESESLNAAVAGSIILFEALRQKRLTVGV